MLWEQWACRDDFQPFFRLDHYPFLCRLAALGTLAYELGFVFALPFRRLRPWLCILGILFHVGIALIMGLNFWPLLVYYPTLIDWGRFLGQSGEPGAAPASNRPLHRLGAGLALGVTLAGLVHLNSWPFSVMPTFAEMAPTEVPVIRIIARNGDVRSVIPPDRLYPYFMHASGWQVYQYRMVCATIREREELCAHLRNSVLPKLGLSCDEIEVEQSLIHTDPDRRGEPPLCAAPYASWRNAPGAPIRVSDARLPLERHFPPAYRLVFFLGVSAKRRCMPSGASCDFRNKPGAARHCIRQSSRAEKGTSYIFGVELSAKTRLGCLTAVGRLFVCGQVRGLRRRGAGDRRTAPPGGRPLGDQAVKHSLCAAGELLDQTRLPARAARTPAQAIRGQPAARRPRPRRPRGPPAPRVRR